MKISLFQPNIEITKNYLKLMEDLEKSNIEFSKTNSVIYFKGVLKEGLPECIINVHIVKGEVGYVNIGYNYKEEEYDKALEHKVLFDEYMTASFGSASKVEQDEETQVITSVWIDKKEYINYYYNGPGFHLTMHHQQDVLIQVIFNQSFNDQFTTTELKKLCALCAVMIFAGLLIYYLVTNSFNLLNMLLCLGVGLGSFIVLYIVSRFFMQGNLYSKREENLSKKLFD
jgi:hypothetical protein